MQDTWSCAGARSYECVRFEYWQSSAMRLTWPCTWSRAWACSRSGAFTKSQQRPSWSEMLSISYRVLYLAQCQVPSQVPSQVRFLFTESACSSVLGWSALPYLALYQVPFLVRCLVRCLARCLRACQSIEADYRQLKMSYLGPSLVLCPDPCLRSALATSHVQIQQTTYQVPFLDHHLLRRR